MFVRTLGQSIEAMEFSGCVRFGRPRRGARAPPSIYRRPRLAAFSPSWEPHTPTRFREDNNRTATRVFAAEQVVRPFSHALCSCFGTWMQNRTTHFTRDNIEEATLGLLKFLNRWVFFFKQAKRVYLLHLRVVFGWRLGDTFQKASVAPRTARVWWRHEACSQIVRWHPPSLRLLIKKKLSLVIHIQSRRDAFFF